MRDLMLTLSEIVHGDLPFMGLGDRVKRVVAMGVNERAHFLRSLMTQRLAKIRL